MALSKLYYKSSLFKKLELQKKTNSNKSICLFSDLDDSYILKYWPSEEILEEYSQKYTDTILSPDAKTYIPSLELKQYLDQHHIPLIIVTGRDLYQMHELMSSFKKSFPQIRDIMDFDAIIGAVGTEIYIKSNNDSYQLDQQYANVVDATLFDREKVYTILKHLILVIKQRFDPIIFDFCKRDKRNSKDELPKLKYKISYEFKSDPPTAQQILIMIRNELEKNGLGSINVVISCPYAIDGTINKYNVDIVPTSKEKAILYLKSLLDIYSVVAGDSGNDIGMLTQYADYAIVVGNAKNELKLAVAHLSDDEKKRIILAPSTTLGPNSILTIIQSIV